ncbi:MAG: pectin esterase [Lewinellaceae bacterium]|nr:pectin esterase [Lewinellaceae bacterium]
MVPIKAIYRTGLIAGLLLCTCLRHAQAQYATEITVAQDGSGDFTSIQDAVDASKAFPGQRITIHIKSGTYREKVKIHAWNTMLSLIGEGADKTVITYNDHFNKIARGRNSTFHTYTMLVQGNDFRAEGLSIENTAGPVGQAVALSVEADRCVFENCTFTGHQDTLYVAGEGARSYFHNCYIEGTTDFIFGAGTAVFEQCRIHAKSDSYITAASTPKGIPYGLVFLKCSITAAEGVKGVYLGRPWRPYAKTVFLNCEMSGQVQPEGWHHWEAPEKEPNVYYAEYRSTGAGARPASRASWPHQLNRRQSKKYTLDHIFSGWKP